MIYPQYIRSGEVGPSCHLLEAIVSSCHEEIYSCMGNLFDRFHSEIICMEITGDVKKDKASVERHTLEEERKKKKMLLSQNMSLSISQSPMLK